MSAAFVYEQQAIARAKGALDEFNEAVKRHRQEQAEIAADSMLSVWWTSQQAWQDPIATVHRADSPDWTFSSRAGGRDQEFKEAADKFASAESLKKAKELTKSLQDSIDHWGANSNQSKAARCWRLA